MMMMKRWDLKFIVNLLRVFCLYHYVPLVVAVCVTYRCPCHCGMCRQVQRDLRRDLQRDLHELSLQEIEQLFNYLKKRGTKFLHLTGGEPLMRRDLKEILILARKCRFYITLQTSGVDPYGIFSETLPYVDHYFLSIDGVKSIHDSNRGEGAYQHTLELITMLKSAKKKIKLCCAYGEYNKASLPHLLNLSQGLQVPIKFTPIVLGRHNKNEINKYYAPTAETINEVVNHLLKAKKNNPFISSSKEALLNFQRKSLRGRKSCNYCYLKILPSGIAQRCSLIDENSDSSVQLKLETYQSFINSLKNMPLTQCENPVLNCSELSNFLQFKINWIIKTLKDL
ncbi:MAG: radical SAM protein [Oligoflexia bacterium]|nr:radical SAM protein [Oligoflexia bacterium]